MGGDFGIAPITVSEKEILRIGAEYAPEIEEFIRLGFQPDIGKLNYEQSKLVLELIFISRKALYTK